MSNIGDTTKIVILLLLPFILYIFLRKPVNKWLKSRQISIRFIDLISVVLIIESHFLTTSIWQTSWLPYFLAIISLLGLIILTVYYQGKTEVSLYRALKVWWRVVDLLSIGMFIAVIVGYLTQLFI